MAARAHGSLCKDFLLLCVFVGAPALVASVRQSAARTEVLLDSGIARPVDRIGLPEGWRWDRQGGPSSARSAARLEVLAFPAESPVDAPETLGVAIVPGNPGVPQYYCHFGEHLHRELEALVGPTTVYVVGYPNFVTNSEPEDVGAHIEVEAESISTALGGLHRVHRKRGLALFGHSIGAWVVAQHLLGIVVRDQPEVAPSVPLAVFAMPYLEFFGNWNQRLVSILAGLPVYGPLARLITSAAMAVPASIYDFVCPYAVSKNTEHCDITKATLFQQPHHLMGMFLMVKSEVQRLSPEATPGAGLQEFEPLFRSSKRPPVLSLVTRGDIWSPECHAERLRAMLSDGDDVVYLANETSGCVVQGRPPSHSFVLDDEFLRPIAALVAGRVAQELARKR